MNKPHLDLRICQMTLQWKDKQTLYLISIPMANPNGGGTAFPTCLCFSKMVPWNLEQRPRISQERDLWFAEIGGC